MGFQLGFVDEQELLGEKALLNLKSGNPNRLFRRCFTYHGIREAFGKIPQENGEGHFIAVRKIPDSIDDNAYINIGFETDSERDFQSTLCFLAQYRERNLELFRKIDATISRDSSDSSFGLHIVKDMLIEMLEEARKSDRTTAEPGFCFCANSGIPVNVLEEDIGLSQIFPEQSMAVRPAPDMGADWFRIERKGEGSNSDTPFKTIKKNRLTLILLKGLIGAGILIAILIGWLMRNS